MTATNENPDVEAIKAAIQTFFDSINAADTEALLANFFPSANLTIIRQDPPLPPPTDIAAACTALPPSSNTPPSPAEKDEAKLTVIMRTSIENFVKLIEDGQKRRKGKPGPELFESPDLDATHVKLDSLFACAWSPFKVTFDGVLHHYGTMVYTLGKNELGEWRIEGLTQNYRRTPGWDVKGVSLLDSF